MPIDGPILGVIIALPICVCCILSCMFYFICINSWGLGNYNDCFGIVCCCNSNTGFLWNYYCHKWFGCSCDCCDSDSTNNREKFQNETQKINTQQPNYSPVHVSVIVKQ